METASARPTTIPIFLLRPATNEEQTSFRESQGKLCKRKEAAQLDKMCILQNTNKIFFCIL